MTERDRQRLDQALTHVGALLSVIRRAITDGAKPHSYHAPLIAEARDFYDLETENKKPTPEGAG